MKCGECGNTLPPRDGFPKQVFCKQFHLHMGIYEDASRCRDFEKKPQTNEPTPSDIRPIHSRIDHYGLDMEKGTLSYHVIKTNADKIRSMTDEELAEFINPADCIDCPLTHDPNCMDGASSCKDAILRWLKQEVKS